MRIKRFRCALLMGTTAIFTGLLFAAQKAPTPSKSESESHEAVRLLKAIRAESEHIRSSALDLEKLTQTSGAKWSQYDRQWNEIKPEQEALDINLRRLEAIEGSLTPSERKAVEESKPMIRKIANQTHQLGTLFDQPGVDVSSPEFKTYAKSLVNQAGEVVEAAKAGLQVHSAKLDKGAKSHS